MGCLKTALRDSKLLPDVGNPAGFRGILRNFLADDRAKVCHVNAMPIYEFYCPDTHCIYQFYSRTLANANRVPRCPENPDYEMKRAVSMFNPAGLTRKSRGEPGEGGEMDDPRMMQAMEEIERDLAGMDEDNPDPRKLAQAMRKMSSITGEDLPEDMEEMIGRMEAGEDLEALEEEFGDMNMDDMPGGEGAGGAEGADEEGGPGGAATTTSASLKQRQIAMLRKAGGKPPRRDANIYEMADYLPAPD
jgi:hypothetical protein